MLTEGEYALLLGVVHGAYLLSDAIRGEWHGSMGLMGMAEEDACEIAFRAWKYCKEEREANEAQGHE